MLSGVSHYLVLVFTYSFYFVSFAVWNSKQTSICKQWADNLAWVATSLLIDSELETCNMSGFATHRLPTHRLTTHTSFGSQHANCWLTGSQTRNLRIFRFVTPYLLIRNSLLTGLQFRITHKTNGNWNTTLRGLFRILWNISNKWFTKTVDSF